MRKIILEKTLEFGSRCDFAIYDVTDCAESGQGKKRGTITIDYSPADVRNLISEGKDLEAALLYYRDRIYSLVKYYISGDWECVSGLDGALETITKHIKPYF